MEVTVYSTTYCPSCVSLKNWLRDKNIDYKSVNLEEEPQKQAEIFEKTNSLMVPITLVKFDDGSEEIIIGPQYGQLKKVLKIT